MMYAGNHIIDKELQEVQKDPLISHANKVLTTRERGKLVIDFMNCQTNPMKNRKFYEFFYA